MLSDGVAVDVPSWPRASHLRWYYRGHLLPKRQQLCSTHSINLIDHSVRRVLADVARPSSAGTPYTTTIPDILVAVGLGYEVLFVDELIASGIYKWLNIRTIASG
ncbi:predicted protein [Histoplasma capsulatum G186AR]|uniref:Uncharacterized protein n=1 Tax=Ajellomyces capsulatus (strain G186AR / H82 / ATCC MYA-2454 / RMSCC 2432) TaxID=447093 RepID=C0NM98_AJECG|nr:uncharacterized protein HCBG_04628 [Histoplasma capsulatum G186AR]EEH07749.1 predicted protein [Histoplasma capsulatum G186AR]